MTCDDDTRFSADLVLVESHDDILARHDVKQQVLVVRVGRQIGRGVVVASVRL